MKYQEKEMVLDLETVSTPSNEPGKRDLVAILSIGATVFDAGVVNTFEELIEHNAEKPLLPSEQYISDRVLYTPVSFMHSLSHGFNTNPDTLQFWKDQVQYKGSYNMVEAASAFVEDIKFTFAKVDQWLKRHRDVKRIWMRDQSFDGTILREAFNHLGFVLPINPFILRDHRCITDNALFGIKFPEKHELQMAHHALHDAAQEAMMRQQLWVKLNPGPADDDTKAVDESPETPDPADLDAKTGESDKANEGQADVEAAKVVGSKANKRSAKAVGASAAATKPKSGKKR